MTKDLLSPRRPASSEHDKEKRAWLIFLFFSRSFFVFPHLTLTPHSSSLSLSRSIVAANMLLAASCSALLRRGAQRASLFSGASTATRGLQTQALPDLPVTITGEFFFFFFFFFRFVCPSLSTPFLLSTSSSFPPLSSTEKNRQTHQHNRFKKQKQKISALEPVIPAEIMRLHHSKHHQAYVTNLNAGAEKYAAAEARNDVAAMISLQPALKFNGGGHLNHSMLWGTLCPAKDFELPTGALARAIEESFGGGAGEGGKQQQSALEKLQAEMAAAAVGVQGSGWAWLGFDPAAAAHGGGGPGRLVVRATANQDPLGAAFPGLVPLYGVDVWEHAYYLKYKNARPDYVREIWKVTDWRKVAALFEEAAAAA